MAARRQNCNALPSEERSSNILSESRSHFGSNSKDNSTHPQDAVEHIHITILPVSASVSSTSDLTREMHNRSHGHIVHPGPSLNSEADAAGGTEGEVTSTTANESKDSASSVDYYDQESLIDDNSRSHIALDDLDSDISFEIVGFRYEESDSEDDDKSGGEEASEWLEEEEGVEEGEGDEAESCGDREYDDEEDERGTGVESNTESDEGEESDNSDDTTYYTCLEGESFDAESEAASLGERGM